MPIEGAKRLVTRFSTDAVPVRDRVSVAREILGRVHLRMDLEPLGEAPFQGRFEQQTWAFSSLFVTDTDPVCFARTSELLTDGMSDFRIGTVEGTKLSFASRDCTEELDSGDAALWCSAEPGTNRTLSRGSLYSIRLPSDRLLAAVPGLEGRALRRIAADSPALRLLKAYAAILRGRGPSGDPLLDHHAAQHLVDLAALALGPSEETRERAAAGAQRTARLATIRADALANLGQARLSAKTLAQRHGLSDRYIHVLFEETGQTFSRFVEEERLKRAFALLMDPNHADTSINDIAAKVGYVDHSTFTRAFRRRFGDTPRAVRGNRKTQ